MMSLILRELSAICHAVGVLEPRDSTELHNLPLTVSVRCSKNPDTGEPTNEIKGYAAPTGATAVHKAQSPATNAAPPWAR